MSANTANTVNVINSIIPLHHRPRRRPPVVADAVTTPPIPASPEQSPRHRRGNVTSITPETATSDADMRGLAIRYADAAPTKIGKSDVRKSFEFRNKGVLLYVRALTKTWQTLVFISVNGAPAQWLEIEEARSRDTGGVVPRETLYGVDKLEASDRPVLVLDQNYITDADMIQSRLGDGYIVVSVSKNADLSPLNGRDVVLFGDDAFLQNTGNKLLKSAATCRNLEINPIVFRNIQNADEMIQHVVPYTQRYEVSDVKNFIQKKDGLYFCEINQSGEMISEEKITSRFNMLPNIEIIEDEGVNRRHRKRVQFQNMMNPRNETVVEPILVGTKTEILSEVGKLREMGLVVSTENDNRLASYLSQVQILADTVYGVKFFGWSKINGKWVFILPNKIIQSGEENVDIINMAKFATKFSQKGTLGDMRKLLDMCRRNRRLIFAVCNAFASPIITIMPGVYRELGGYNFAGKTSSGKTTLLAAAAAMWGLGSTDEKAGGIIRSCSATANGLENAIEAANDTFLALDELGRISAKTLSELSYGLANGSGRQRMARDGGQRHTKSWNTTFIATGEKTFTEILAEGDMPAKSGQILRFTDLDANGGKFGIFDDTAKLTPAEFSSEIKRLANEFYGTPSVKFLQGLVDDRNAGVLEEKVHALHEEFISKTAHIKLNGELERLNNKFALTAVAGCLAVEYGALPWTKYECMFETTMMYSEYITSSGIQYKNSDEKNLFDAMADFISQYTGSASFQNINGKQTDRSIEYDKPGNEGMLAMFEEYAEGDDTHYYLFSGAVNKIIKNSNVSKKLAIKILTEKGILLDRKVIETRANDRRSVRAWIISQTKFDELMEKTNSNF